MSPDKTLVERYTGLPINYLARQLNFSRFGGPLNQLRSGLHSLGRAAAASVDPGEAWLQEGERLARANSRTQQPTGPTRDIYEQPGVGWFDRSSGRFLGPSSHVAPPPPVLPPPSAAPGMGVTPIVRHDDDQYRQMLSQYSNLAAAGRKGDLAKQDEAEALGMKIWKEKYKDTLAKQQKTENPLMRQMFPERYGEPTLGPASATLQADPALKGVTTFFPGAEPNSFTPGVGNPVPPTVIFNQGAMMDANRGVENLQAWQKLKTNEMNFASQQPSGVLEGIGERVRSYLADKANTGQFVYGKQ